MKQLKVTEIANEVPLDVIQLHGDEDVIYIEQLRQQTDKENLESGQSERCCKRHQGSPTASVDKLLLDTFAEEKDICMEVLEK